MRAGGGWGGVGWGGGIYSKEVFEQVVGMLLCVFTVVDEPGTRIQKRISAMFDPIVLV